VAVFYTFCIPLPLSPIGNISVNKWLVVILDFCLLGHIWRWCTCRLITLHPESASSPPSTQHTTVSSFQFLQHKPGCVQSSGLFLLSTMKGILPTVRLWRLPTWPWQWASRASNIIRRSKQLRSQTSWKLLRDLLMSSVTQLLSPLSNGLASFCSKRGSVS